MTVGNPRPALLDWSQRYDHLREVTLGKQGKPGSFGRKRARAAGQPSTRAGTGAGPGISSLIPYLAYRRRSGRGAHQLARPSSRMVAGTSSTRTTVASTSSATIMPTPISLMNVMPDAENAPTTMISSSGQAGDHAAGPLQAAATEAVLSPVWSYTLADPGQQEHLVVHGQAEDDRQHQDRHRRVDGAGRGEPQQAGQVPPLEDPHDRRRTSPTATARSSRSP